MYAIKPRPIVSQSLHQGLLDVVEHPLPLGLEIKQEGVLVQSLQSPIQYVFNILFVRRVVALRVVIDPLDSAWEFQFFIELALTDYFWLRILLLEPFDLDQLLQLFVILSSVSRSRTAWSQHGHRPPLHRSLSGLIEQIFLLVLLHTHFDIVHFWMRQSLGRKRLSTARERSSAFEFLGILDIVTRMLLVFKHIDDWFVFRSKTVGHSRSGFRSIEDGLGLSGSVLKLFS